VLVGLPWPDIYKMQTCIYYIYMLGACVGHYVTFKGDKERLRPKSNHKIRVEMAFVALAAVKL